MILRRRTLLVAIASLAWADTTQQEVADLAGDLAGALADGDAEAFLLHVSKNMPGRAELRDNLLALLAGADVNSGADIIDITEQGKALQVNLDWSMHVSTKGISGGLEQRHETVTLQLERQGKKKWQVAALKPISFFRPLRTTG